MKSQAVPVGLSAYSYHLTANKVKHQRLLYRWMFHLNDELLDYPFRVAHAKIEEILEHNENKTPDTNPLVLSLPLQLAITVIIWLYITTSQKIYSWPKNLGYNPGVPLMWLIWNDMWFNYVYLAAEYGHVIHQLLIRFIQLHASPLYSNNPTWVTTNQGYV